MIKKEIAEKLFKAELAQEKVELALTDDLKQLIKDAEARLTEQKDAIKWGNKAEVEFAETMKLVSDAEGITRGAIKRSAQLVEKSQSILRAVRAAAADLGVSENSIDGYNRAFKLIAEIFDNQNALNGWNDALRKKL